MTSDPRAAYIHVPFCRHRCGYCNFTLVARRDDLIDAYLDALERELIAFGGPHEIDTLFFGGGTPTHLPPKQLERLFAIAQCCFPLVSGEYVGWAVPTTPPPPAPEFTIEANPTDLNDEKSKILAASGVTRLSLGAQSFHASKLKILERDHDAATIRAAVEFARSFAQSISLDLIFGVPGETLADWQADLDQALALSPDHISTYGLTFEKGTNFWSRLNHGELKQTDEDLERQMYELAIDRLTAAGYEHYEVSNFARPSHRCRHNENYWLGGQYFAAGPGASRFIAGRRETNHKSTTTYIHRVLSGQSPVAESEHLNPEDSARERLVFALRRLEGISPAHFAATTGFTIDDLIGPTLQPLLDRGLLSRTSTNLRLTRPGLLLSDSIWPYFLRG
ncbi:MAG TPA: radical SAM family heme chaperone HemW [Pirellulaceae bacterium]|jgi:oxygen-independent coproporphyrinogen-3 oxidase